MNGDAPIKVLVVDDDPMAVAGISAIVGSAPDIRVVGDCSDGDQIVEAVSRLSPDVILCDVRMARMDGTAAIERLDGSLARFLMITAFDEDGLVLEAVRAGAAGFLLKDEDPQQIINAVREVAAGESPFSPRSARHLKTWARAALSDENRRVARAKVATLTKREREFAGAVLRGSSDAEIAQQLYVAETTVKSTLQTIRTKFGARTRTDLAVILAYADAP